jgi:hypothetical protein
MYLFFSQASVVVESSANLRFFTKQKLWTRAATWQQKLEADFSQLQGISFHFNEGKISFKIRHRFRLKLYFQWRKLAR